MSEYAYQLDLPPLQEIIKPSVRANMWQGLDALVTVTDVQEFVDPTWHNFRGLPWVKAMIFKKAPGWYGPVHTDHDTVQPWAINWIDGDGGGMEFWHPDNVDSSELCYDPGGRTPGRTKGWVHTVSKPADRVYLTPPGTAWLVNVRVPHNGFNPITSTQPRWAFSMRTQLGSLPNTFESAAELFSDLIVKK